MFRTRTWRLLSGCAAVLFLVSAVHGADGGRRFIGGDDSKRKVAIVNAKGEIEWEFPVGPIHDVHVLPNGNVLFQKNWTQILEVTPDAEKKIVWSYDAGKMNGNEGKRVEVHAFQRLPDGNTMIAESGVSRIIEVDKDGKLVKEIKLKVKSSNTHSDTRLVRKIANGNYLVAHEAEGAVREYDSAGNVVWDYPVPMFDKNGAGGHGPEGFGNKCYSAIRLTNGNTLIGTGNGHSVIEVTPAKEIVWHLKQDDLPGIKLAWVTHVHSLPNGNIILGNCHAGPENPQIIEVTREKKVVWSFKDFKNFGNSFPIAQILDVDAIR